MLTRWLIKAPDIQTMALGHRGRARELLIQQGANPALFEETELHPFNPNLITVEEVAWNRK